VEFVAEDQQIPEIDPTANLLVVVAARLNRLTGRVLSRLDIPLTYRQHRLLYRVSQGVTSLEDRRQRHLELTELGRSACTAGQLALGKIMEELINDLPPEHRDVLHETLASVYDAATTHFKADGSR
jgi:hypothetical protein